MSRPKGIEVLGIRPVPAVYGTTYGPGDCFFTADAPGGRSDIVAAGITYLTRWERYGQVPVNHVGIIVGPGLGIEAKMGTGTDFCDMHEAYFDNPEVLVFIRRPYGCTPTHGRLLADIAASRRGRKYDTALLLAHGITGSLCGRLIDWATNGALKRALANRLQRDDADICSEGVCHSLIAWRRALGMALVGCLLDPPETVSPQRLFGDMAIFNEWKSGVVAEFDANEKVAAVGRMVGGLA